MMAGFDWRMAWARWKTPSPGYDPAKPLFSIHIPKCGGTSVGESLGRWFGDRLYPHYADEAAGKLPQKWPTGPGTCVHGHFNNRRGFGVLDYYPDAEQFITFLRDPFELHVSLYFYLKQHCQEYSHAGRQYDIRTEFPDLGAFLEAICADREHPLSLSMLRYIPFELTASNYRERLLGRFIHVGVTDDLANSIAILARKLGFEAGPVGHLNASARDPSRDYLAHGRMHRKCFALEHEIYRFAKASHAAEAWRYAAGRAFGRA